MRISLDELIREQHNIGCWFDRKTYTILHSDSSPEDHSPYPRYIPLYQVDWEMIDFDFLSKINDSDIVNRWKKSGLSASAFIERAGLDRRWYEYLYAAKRNLAIQWCRENNIRFEGEETV